MLEKTAPARKAFELGEPSAQADPASIDRQHKRNNFDLLRLAGALLVFSGHVHYTYFGRTGDWFSWLSGVQHGAFLGVGIFFVVSGYLVTQSRWRSSSIGSFALKRAARIVP